MSRRLALLAALASASAPACALEANPYGFVLFNGAQQWGRANALDVPTLAVSAADAGAGGTFNEATARQSRVGLSIGGASALGAALTGVVEADFFGIRAAGAAANDVLQSGPRLRLAYLQLQWEGQALVLGQDWTRAFSPLRPNSLARQAVVAFTASGVLWNRMPQIRWEGSLPLGAAALNAKAAAVRAFSADESGRLSGSVPQASQLDQTGSGEAASGPAYQALLELERRVPAGRWAAGISGQYLRQRFVSGLVSPPAGASAGVVEGVLGAAHIVAPVFAWLELSAQGFYGRSDQNLMGLGQIVNDSGRPASSLTRGGWAQLALKPAKGWQANVSYGGERPDDAGFASGAVRSNQTALANVIWDCSKELSWSVEYGTVTTQYVGKSEGTSRSLGLAAMLRY
jgi:hypothetical protein